MELRSLREGGQVTKLTDKGGLESRKTSTKAAQPRGESERKGKKIDVLAVKKEGVRQRLFSPQKRRAP